MIEIKHRDGRVLFVAEHAQDVRAALVQAANGGADLRGAYLGGAYLGGADLRGAYLGGANLGDAYLRGANLGDANLRDANLRGANLRDAKGLNPRRVNDLLILREQVGKIRAYKLVRADGQGPYSGGITYEVGGTYEVTDANTDDMVECGVGINLATLPWCCREWQPGRRILVAEFTGRDIAAIPTGGGGKFRVSRCRIVRELDLAEIGLVGEAT